MVKLKEQLREAKNEIQHLIEGNERISSNSPSSSITVDATTLPPPCFGEIFLEEYEDVFYCMQENNYNQAFEWLNPYM